MSDVPVQSVASPGFERLVLFDGVCGFCEGFVQWLLARDPEGRLRFAPLQGEVAQRLRVRHPEIPAGYETIVYVEALGDGERIYLRTAAIVAVCRALARPPFWLGALAVLPTGPADRVYGLFVRVRYRIFGKRDACRVPTPEERARFLD